MRNNAVTDQWGTTQVRDKQGLAQTPPESAQLQTALCARPSSSTVRCSAWRRMVSKRVWLLEQLVASRRALSSAKRTQSCASVVACMAPA